MATKAPRRRLHCYWCKRDLMPPEARTRVAKTRDHVVPRCKGGRKTVPCCRQCNQLKGDWQPEYWREVMRIFPRWWKQFDHRGQLLMALKVRLAAHQREVAERGRWPRSVVIQRSPMRGLNYRIAA